MTLIFRKPCTSPLPEVHLIFDRLEGRDLTLEQLAEQMGYSKDAIMALRRPHKSKHGSNPSFQLMRDLARFAGCNLTLVAPND